MEWLQLPLLAYLTFLLRKFVRRQFPRQTLSDAPNTTTLRAQITQAVLLALLAKAVMCLMAFMTINFQVEETLLELWALAHFGQVYAALYQLTELLSADQLPTVPLFRDKCLLSFLGVGLTGLGLVFTLSDAPLQLEFVLFFSVTAYLAFWSHRTHRIFHGIERGFSHPFELTADRKDLRRAVVSSAAVTRLPQLRFREREDPLSGLLSPRPLPRLPPDLPPPHQAP